ncbi:unnamed protein product, partial [Didymodactylos carnosus]
MKSGETLMEVRSDSDVQIDRQILVKGRKTNRTVYSGCYKGIIESVKSICSKATSKTVYASVPSGTT